MVGLPKSIIKKYGITKKAWSVFRGKKRSSKPSRSSNPKGGKIRNMARKRARRGRSSMTIPLAPTLGLLSAFLVRNAKTGGAPPVESIMAGDLNTAALDLMISLTGYNSSTGTWDITNAQGLWAAVAGLLVHKFVGGRPLNLNATLARAKVPFIRI